MARKNPALACVSFTFSLLFIALGIYLVTVTGQKGETKKAVLGGLVFLALAVTFGVAAWALFKKQEDYDPVRRNTQKIDFEVTVSPQIEFKTVDLTLGSRV